MVALIGLSPKPDWVRWYPLPVPAEITPGKTFRRESRADFGDFCLYFSTNSRFQAALPLLGHADLIEAS